MSISIRQNQDGQHVLVCDTQPRPGQARETFWLPVTGIPHLRWKTTKRASSERWRDGTCTNATDDQRTTLVFSLDGGGAQVVITEVDTVDVRNDSYCASITYTVEPRGVWHAARALPHDLPLPPDTWLPVWEWSSNEWRMEDRTYRPDATPVTTSTKEHDHADV